MEPYYITTPIYYVNAEPHIGHAYTTTAADARARWARFCGKKVFFLTGTDEHGSKIAAAAEKEGISPQALADRMVVQYQRLWQILEISFDRFIRTTEPAHAKVVQTVFVKLLKKGDIYAGRYEGYYCLFCENYLTPKEGTTCPDCGRPAQYLAEDSYFFRLSSYQKQLQRYCAEHPLFVQPKQIQEEVAHMLSQPLPDLSLTRRCRWGIPLPEEAQKSGLEEMTIYVWFDALLNYLSGLGGFESKLFEELWPPQVQLIGKDIIRFHHIIWPTLLMALNLPLPTTIFAHGWWLSGGEKMSKSKGNAIEPLAFCQQYGSEALRYFLLAEVPFGLDGDFTIEAFRKRYNSDLANDFGNLIHRFQRLLKTLCDGKVPPAGEGGPLAEKAVGIFPELNSSMEALDFYGFLEKIRGLISAANRYLDEMAPWRPGVDVNPILYNLVETSRLLSLYLNPILPKTTVALRKQLGISELPAGKEAVCWGLTPAGATINEAPPLFPRLT